MFKKLHAITDNYQLSQDANEPKMALSEVIQTANWNYEIKGVMQ